MRARDFDVTFSYAEGNWIFFPDPTVVTAVVEKLPEPTPCIDFDHVYRFNT